jgi:hypothetical protein
MKTQSTTTNSTFKFLIAKDVIISGCQEQNQYANVQNVKVIIGRKLKKLKKQK